MSKPCEPNSQFHYIKNIIHLQDELIEVSNITESYINNIKTIEIHIFRKKEATSCPACNSIDYIIHSHYSRTIKYSDIAGHNTVLKYKQRRYRCKVCNKTFNEPCNIVESSANISNNLKLKVIEECKHKQSFKDISKTTNLSESMVSKIFVNHVSIARNSLTETLCFDEFRATTDAGKYAFIIGDPISGEIIDIIKTRTRDFLESYFNSIPFTERETVKYIVTDLFEPYRSIIRIYFPNAVHIADRFHWVRQATEAFNKLRIRVMKNYQVLGEKMFRGKYNKYSTFYYQLKRYWKLLLKNRYATPESFFEKDQYDYYSKSTMTINGLIERMVNLDVDLEDGYCKLQELYRIAKSETFDSARDKFEDWILEVRSNKNRIKEFESVADTYLNWLDEIINSFIVNPITKKRMTNGFIEGKNNICKTIKRIGFGYPSFETYKSRVLFSTNKNVVIKN